MSKAGLLASSVSAFALMCFGADAHSIISDPAHPNLTVTPDRIIQSPAATDKYRQRRFNIILKPDAAASAAAVQNYFDGFGFQTQYHAYTNSIELRGTYAQAEQAGSFTYVTPNDTGATPTAPYQLSSAPHFPASISNAVLATTFAPGPVMEPQFSVTINAPSLLPVHFGKAGLAPEDYATLYGYNQLYAAGIDGSGQIVDIAACFGYLHGATPGVNDDITIFGQDFGLSPSPNITAFYPSGHVDGACSFEPILDLSRVYGTAPGAAIRSWFRQTAHSANSPIYSLTLPTISRRMGRPRFPCPTGFQSCSRWPDTARRSSLQRTRRCPGSPAGQARRWPCLPRRATMATSLFETTLTSAPFSISGCNWGPPTCCFLLLTQCDRRRRHHSVPSSPTNVVRSAEFAWSGATSGNLGGWGGGVSNIWGLPPWQQGVGHGIADIQERSRRFIGCLC